MSFVNEKMSFKNNSIRFQWLTQEKTSVYEVSEKGGQITWKLISYSNPIRSEGEPLAEYKANDIEVPIPYKCHFPECKIFTEDPNHTLYCLVVHIVKSSRTRRIHVEDVCSKLAGISDFYYEIPIWKLVRKITSVIQIKDSLIIIDDEYCQQRSELKSKADSCETQDSILDQSSSPKTKRRKTIPEIILDCFKCEFPIDPLSLSLSTSDIFNQIQLIDPEITNSIVYQNLLKYPQLFKKEIRPGSDNLCWRLKRKKQKEKKDPKLSWKKMIAIVLHGRALTSVEIYDQIAAVFPEAAIEQWRNAIANNLSKYECFKKYVERRWYITDDDFELIFKE